MPREIFPDKKHALTNYQRITDHIREGHSIKEEMMVGQEKAVWGLLAEYPTLPVGLVWMTDIHYGHSDTLYDKLDRHFDIAQEVPNMRALIGGDGIDNFAIKHAHAGINGDEISPQIQAQAFMEKLTQLDKENRLGVVVYGNHEDWMNLAGYDYYQTFMRELHAPIFHKGGILTVMLKSQEYKIAVTHQHWGMSKLNITNGAKRGMEFSWPGVDAVLLGDDHQASSEVFSRGGKRQVAIDGGTYKNDSLGMKWGLGPPGEPGYTLLLWPNERRMEVVNIETARTFMQALIGEANHYRKMSTSKSK